MAKNTQLSNTTANAQADSLATLCNSGFIRIYDGTQPANANTAITSQVLLATLTFGATAFGAASAGVITANAITSGTAGNSGTASWCRIVKSDGTTVVMDGTVATATANLILSTTTITAGIVVGCSSFTHTVALATTGS
jgi:phosphatidylglycerophosphatase A